MSCCVTHMTGHPCSLILELGPLSSQGRQDPWSGRGVLMRCLNEVTGPLRGGRAVVGRTHPSEGSLDGNSICVIIPEQIFYPGTVLPLPTPSLWLLGHR